MHSIRRRGKHSLPPRYRNVGIPPPSSLADLPWTCRDTAKTLLRCPIMVSRWIPITPATRGARGGVSTGRTSLVTCRVRCQVRKWLLREGLCSGKEVIRSRQSSAPLERSKHAETQRTGALLGPREAPSCLDFFLRLSSLCRSKRGKANTAQLAVRGINEAVSA